MRKLSIFPQLLLIFSGLILSSLAALSFKIAFNGNWSPGYIGFARNIFLFLFPFLLLQISKTNIWGDNLKQRTILLLSCFFKISSLLIYLVALSITPLYIIGILSAISPVLEIILIKYIYRREHVASNELIGILITSFALIYLFSIKFESQAIDGSLLFYSGTYLILISSILRIMMIINNKIAIENNLTAKQLVATSSLLAIPVFLTYGIIFEPTFSFAHVLNTRDILVFLNLITFCGIFLFLYLRWMLNFIDLKNQAKLRGLEPCLILIFSYFILNEDINVKSIYAFILILSGIVLASTRSQ